jgi:hypothetical protein
MSRRLATYYAQFHHEIPPLPEPLPSTTNNDADAFEDNDVEESCEEEEDEEEIEPPPCALLQASLFDSFESAHRGSSIGTIRVIVLEQTNVAIPNQVAKISVEFSKKRRPVEGTWRLNGGP